MESGSDNSDPKVCVPLLASHRNGGEKIIEIESSENKIYKNNIRIIELSDLSADKGKLENVINNIEESSDNNVAKENEFHLAAVKIEESDISPPNKQQRGYKKYLGIGLTVAAAIQYSLSALIIKKLNYHPFNLGVWRFFIMILIPIPFLVHAVFWKKQPVFNVIWPITTTTFLLLMQAVVGSNSLVLLFYGINNLNFADCLVISTSAPVFVTILAFFFLGEKCGVVPVITALFTLLGVGIISRPPLLTGSTTLDETAMLGVSMAFGSMMLLTVSYVIVRHLRVVHHALLNLLFSLWGFTQSLIFAFAMDLIKIPSGPEEILLIFATAILAFFAQTCVTLALKYEQTGPVSLIRTSEVIFAFMWQWIFLGVVPDVFSISGASLVIFCVVLTTLRKMIISLPEHHKFRKTFAVLLL